MSQAKDSLHYVISSYPGRLPSRANVQIAAEMLHLHLGALLALLEEKKKKEIPSFLAQVTVVVTRCKAEHEPPYENYYEQKSWLREFERRAPGVSLVFLPYQGENKHYSYDQWLQAMVAFPRFTHHLVVEDDFCIHPSCLDFDSLLLAEYERVFPRGVGYLCSLEADGPEHGVGSSVSNGVISQRTIDLLAPNPLEKYYSLSGYPQVTFDRLFRNVAADSLAAGSLVADMTLTFRALFWDTPSCSLLDLTAHSARGSPADARLRLGIVPLQLVDRETSGLLQNKKCPENSFCAHYRGSLRPLRALSPDVRGFLWKEWGLKVCDLVKGVALGGLLPPQGEKELVFAITSRARPPVEERETLSGEERIEATVKQCRILRGRFPQAGIYLLESSSLTPRDMRRLGEFADWIFLLEKDELAREAASMSKSRRESYSLLSFLILNIPFRRLVKVSAGYCPAGGLESFLQMESPSFSYVPSDKTGSGHPAFVTRAYCIPAAYRNFYLSCIDSFLRGETNPSLPADIEHHMCQWFSKISNETFLFPKIGLVGPSSRGDIVF